MVNPGAGVMLQDKSDTTNIFDKRVGFYTLETDQGYCQSDHNI